MKIRGLVNLITGGCSGLGFGTAKHLVSQGGKVVLLDVNQKAGAECINELGHQNSYFIPCNVTDQTQVKTAYEEANKIFGGIRMYLNCAGITLGDNIIKQTGIHDPAIFKKVIDVNLFGSFLCTAHAAWHLQKVPLEGKERGVILNVSSVASKCALVGFAAYGASKGALEGMLFPIAKELGRYKIRVLNISPGMMLTPMNERISEQDKAKIASHTLRGELGEIQHFAQLVEAIITNGYLNGRTIEIDDGIVPPNF